MSFPLGSTCQFSKNKIVKIPPKTTFDLKLDFSGSIAVVPDTVGFGKKVKLLFTRKGSFTKLLFSSLNPRQGSCQRRLGSESFGRSDGSDVTRSCRNRRSVLRSGPTEDRVTAASRWRRRRLGRSCPLQRSAPRSAFGSSNRVPRTSSDPFTGRSRNRRRRSQRAGWALPI